MTKKIIGLLLILLMVGTITYLVFYKKPIDHNQININEEMTDQQLGEYIDRNYSTEHEKRYGEMMDEYNYAGSVIDEFIWAINDNDYISAYNMINKEFKQKNNYTIERLKIDFPTKGGSEKTVVINEFNKIGDRYVLDVEVINFELDTELQNEYEEKSKKMHFTVFEGRTLAPAKFIDTKESSNILVNNDSLVQNIIGIDKLYTYYGLAGLNDIRENLNLGLSLFRTIDKEIVSTDEKELKQYFEENHIVLFDVYGVVTLDEFENLALKIKEIGQSDITSLVLETDKMITVGNVTKCNFKISTNTTQVEFNIKIAEEHFSTGSKIVVFWE